MAALAVIVNAAQAAEDPKKMEAARQLFSKSAVPACALCHTLKDAAAEGAVGPDLDELKPNAARVAAALRNGIGQMPSYKGRMSDADIAAVAAYVAQASGAK